MKIASIGQAIVQVARPRSIISPLQFGLAVHAHRSYSSRALIELLNRLGFCINYKEVCKFESSAAVMVGAEMNIDPQNIAQEGHIQFIADNVDHNIRTLSGYGTFHGMGIMAVSTPNPVVTRKIARRPISPDEVREIGKIDIFFYRSQWNGLSALNYTEFPDIPHVDSTICLDFMWRVSWPLKSPRPGWSGWMQLMVTGEHPGESSCFFLPMIDMNPSDMSCIYSTLCFICSEADKYKICPIVTFDQPLFWKAQIIVHSEISDSRFAKILIRLGMFHTLMSYLGCIGHIMEGSGLRECLERIYAPHTVTHMLSGKAYARAVRGHGILDAALHAIILAEAYETPWILAHLHVDEDHEDSRECLERNKTTDVAVTEADDAEAFEKDEEDEYFKAIMEAPIGNGIEDGMIESLAGETEIETHMPALEQSVGNDDLDKLSALFEDALKGQVDQEEIEGNAVVLRIKEKIDGYKNNISHCNRTNKLWINYLEMVGLLKKAITAERTGNFRMHLWSVKEMLPYFAACGHIFYAKSARLYLQKMLEAESRNPELFAALESGYHVMRRSDRFWAGISSDLMIEQVLMRSLKSSGGLTRGRGFGDVQRTSWLLAMPACGEVSASMRRLTNLDDVAGNNHKEASNARILRDHNDTRIVLTYLLQRKPFNQLNHGIRSISTGRIADSADVDLAKDIGLKVIDSMTGKSVTEVSFKKKDQVKTMSSSNKIKIGEDIISIDPLLLFQRLLAAGETNHTNLQEYFSYEFTTAPSALFDTSGLMRVSQKSSFTNALWKTHFATDISSVQPAQYVIDGGSLLHKLTWPANITYEALACMYNNYLQNNYPNAIIVFDGYETSSTIKDSVQIRRGLNSCPDIDVKLHACLDITKSTFLSNNNNKQKFIQILTDKLQKSGFRIYQARSDADTLIVKKTLQSAASKTTILIGEDSDLIILLLYHVKGIHQTILMTSSHEAAEKPDMKVWDIQKSKEAIGEDLCEAILFLHAFTGCDTTSHPFSVGKSSALVKFKKDETFRHAVTEFMAALDNDTVIATGERACLYGGKTEAIDELRYRKYMEKVVSRKRVVLPQSLPPTSAATKFHSLRVYHQIQIWKDLIDATQKEATASGWENISGYLHPIYTDLPPAPADLLEVIICQCKTDCSTLRCSCRRHGLNCSTGCRGCRGENWGAFHLRPSENKMFHLRPY